MAIKITNVVSPVVQPPKADAMALPITPMIEIKIFFVIFSTSKKTGGLLRPYF